MMKFLRTLLLALPLTATTLARELPAPPPPTAAADSLAEDTELLERLHNMPNIEIGKGITFQPKNKWMELTLRFRMQNLIGLTFDPNFSLTATEARVKRVRLRFDGYLYSPKIVYSIQLGFSGHDTGNLPRQGELGGRPGMGDAAGCARRVVVASQGLAPPLA